MNTEENKNAKVKLDFKDSKYATGRRKKSIAKVWLKKGSGIIHVNKKKMIDYFINPNLQIAVNRPLKLVNGENIYDIRASVTGGGLSGQAGAVILGIARALVMTDANYKTSLKKEKLTTRDSRSVERKKYGHKKARRSYQFSKR
jgi:small subunit ribosomal protein S9